MDITDNLALKWLSQYISKDILINRWKVVLKDKDVVKSHYGDAHGRKVKVPASYSWKGITVTWINQST